MEKSRKLLIVVDMQNAYTKGNPWYCPNIEVVSDNIRKIVMTGIDTVFTVFNKPCNATGTWKEYNEKYKDINKNYPLNELIFDMGTLLTRVNVLGVFSKQQYSSLSEPEVLEIAKEYDEIIITGVVAECCCMFTAHSAIDLGKKCIWVTDAVAGENAENEVLCQKLLRCHFPLHGKITTTKELIKEIVTEE